jgi:peptide/nickel transport system substrate-binding protein
MTQEKTREERSGISRRRILAAGAALSAGAAAAALAGCSDDDEGGQPSEGKPVKGGVLRGALSRDLSLATGFPFNLGSNRFLEYGMVEPLVIYRDTIEPQLVLAERYEFSSDRTKLTVTLKPGLTFHNGAPVTVEDVFFGIDFLVDPQKYGVTSAFQLTTFAKTIKEKKKVDQRTMEFTFDMPRANINDLFTRLYITQASNFEKLLKGEDVQGTGPYKFKSWTPGQTHVLEANPNWHRTSSKGGPYFEGIEVRFFADPDALGLAFEAGEIDLTFEVEPSAARRFRDQGLTRLNPRRGCRYVGCNVTNPLLADKRVRQGLFYALDRNRFANEVEEGFVKASVQPWPETSPAHDKSLEAPFFDQARARDLLRQASFSQDRPLTVEFTAGFSGNAAAQVVKDNFEAVGVRTELAPLQAVQFAMRHRTRQHPDFFIALFGSAETAPLTMFQFPLPLIIPNPSHYESAEYKDIVAKLEPLEPNSAAAKEQYARFNKLWLDDPWLLPYVPWHPINLVANKVKGYYVNLNGVADLGAFWKTA